MAKRLLAALLLLVSFVGLKAQTQGGYDITFKVKGVNDGYARLAFYLGDKQYIEDSAKFENGKVVFKGNEALEPGIYILAYTKSNKYFELLVNTDGQKFEMETDTVEPIKHMKVTNSIDNRMFYEYLVYLNGKQEQIKPLQDEFKKFKDTNKESADIARKKLDQIDKEVKEYKTRIMTAQGKTFLGSIFNASWEPEVPEAPKLPNGRPDSTFAYRYFKAHYWDKFDFADHRLVRTPLLQSKIRYYMDKLTPQTPDSINVSAKLIGYKAKANNDVFRFTINYITNYYETSKTMGFDAVFVFMAKEFYNTKQAFWADSAQLAAIAQRVIILDPILIGKPALELTLPDTTGKNIKLSSLNAEYTVIIFWDPTCGHCKKEIPKMVDFEKKARAKGVKVYAVGSGGTIEDWKKIIRELDMGAFTNVYDEMGYRKYYDVQTTPVIYMLDKNKIIRAKKLDTPQLQDFLEKQYKLKF